MRRSYNPFIMLQIAVAAAILLIASQPASALQHVRHHRLRHAMRGILWHPLFKPSHDSLIRQNEEIDRLNLPRIQDDEELESLKASGELVPLVASDSLKIEHALDPSRRYCRPWTRDFVEDLSEAYYREFHAQIQVNSAVRTVKVQKRLRRHNRNAAPIDGDTASSHLAGVTLDLQRRGLSKEQIRFIERYLFYLNALGLVEPEEERRHWCFHVMVSDRYSQWRQTQTVIARPSAPEREPAAPAFSAVTATR